VGGPAVSLLDDRACRDLRCGAHGATNRALAQAREMVAKLEEEQALVRQLLGRLEDAGAWVEVDDGFGTDPDRPAWVGFDGAGAATPAEAAAFRRLLYGGP